MDKRSFLMHDGLKGFRGERVALMFSALSKSEG